MRYRKMSFCEGGKFFRFFLYHCVGHLDRTYCAKFQIRRLISKKNSLVTLAVGDELG